MFHVSAIYFIFFAVKHGFAFLFLKDVFAFNYAVLPSFGALLVLTACVW